MTRLDDETRRIPASMLIDPPDFDVSDEPGLPAEFVDVASLLAEVVRLRAENSELRDSLGERTRHNDRLIQECRRLEDEVITATSSDTHHKVMLAGLPFCSCGYSLAGGDATGAFITHVLAMVPGLRATIERVAEAGAEWMRVNDDISVMDDGFNSVIPHADYSALIVAEERLEAALAALGPAGADRQEQP